MISTRQFRKKIKSAKNIAQITKAMEMIAASKMKKAQDQAKASRSYSLGLEEISSVLTNQIDIPSNPLLDSRNDNGKELVLLIASDKGLCGAMLTNLTRLIIQTYEDIGGIQFICIGKRAKNIVRSVEGNIIADFDLGFSSPKYEMVPAISKIISEKYLQEEMSRVSVIYTEFINTMMQKPAQKTLLPLSLIKKEDELNLGNTVLYLYEPSAEKITESLLGMYLEKEIYQFLLEAYASEQSSRMVAMKNATDNAEELTSSLTLEYNQARQAGITAEIIDIGAGTNIQT